MTRLLTIEEVRERTWDDLLHEVAQSRDTFAVTLPEGQTVEIRASGPPDLQPLIQVPGSLPADWNETLYGE